MAFNMRTAWLCNVTAGVREQLYGPILHELQRSQSVAPRRFRERLPCSVRYCSRFERLSNQGQLLSSCDVGWQLCVVSQLCHEPCPQKRACTWTAWYCRRTRPRGVHSVKFEAHGNSYTRHLWKACPVDLHREQQVQLPEWLIHASKSVILEWPQNA